MKDKQILNVNDLIDWKADKEVEYAGNYGKGSHKSLRATLSGGYRVYNHNEIVLECIQPFNAIEKYNSLP